jgi:putative transcriptional regulator
VNPTILIASPQMKDPFFERAVVLVWHHDAEGAIGVVVNRLLSQSLAEVIESDAGIDLSPYKDSKVSWGGPVEARSGTVVAIGQIREDEGWILADGLAVTRSQEALVRLIRQHAPLTLFLGYAGWGAGQLDKEIESGGWICTEPDSEILFSIPADERYDRALATLGLTSSTVWMTPIDE